ncbi:DedA family protein [Phormidium sp. CCY1219]|uniref:DedA family protein n=1 Tax=Phormidium sp. CCY1219 TaxID=2886104 RepID=UPI002D1E9B5B|nr:DedA family protein [Phormidium sp. CCY1219]MEB3827415.1 DedA family protein [Phormidium sp. CCY1219]
MLEWITNIITELGYIGIAFLMFVENIFPPIPSELIMPLAGFTVTQGKLDFGAVFVAGIIGSVAGAFPWYYAGKHFSERRLKRLANKYGKWLALSAEDIDRAKVWFRKRGSFAVFFGRLVPGVRTLISVPAGLHRMNLVSFIIYSTLGTAIWVGLLTTAGYLLGENYGLVEQFIKPISLLVAIGLLIAVVWWIFKRKKQAD